MRKISLVLGLAASLFGTSAYADFTGKNAAGTTITFKNSGDCTAVVCVAQQQPVDSTGAAFGVTANPFFMTIDSGKVVSGAYASGSIGSGAVVDLGAQADNVCGSSTGSCSLIALIKYLNNAAVSAVPAMAATAYNTCGPYTTGVTNPVCMDIYGNMYANISRYLQAAGSPSTTLVMPVQGEAGMTPLLVTQSGNGDPCSSQLTKTNVPISMTGTTTIKLVSLSSAKQIYVCSFSVIASAATVFSLADGTKVSTECDTTAEAVIGATTATHGLSLAANGGMTFGAGSGTVARTTTAAHDLCLFQSGSGDLSGNLTYVQQ